MTYAERKLLRNLFVRFPLQGGSTVVFNARKNYNNLNLYRALERAGKIVITESHNVTTENMLYGMTAITFTFTDGK